MIVPAVGMGFDVYAHHVAGDLFEVLEVEEDGFVRWRGEDAIGPIALVQGTELKDGFVVEVKAFDAVFVFADSYFSHAKVAVDGVDGLAVVLHFDFEVVEEGVVRMPEFCVWDAEGDGAVGLSGCFGYLLVVFIGDRLNLAILEVFA